MLMLRDDEYIVIDRQKGRACVQARESTMCDEREDVGIVCGRHLWLFV